jgi:hypothetical protein
MVVKAIENAVKYGDVRVMEMIMNRTDGLPVQAIKQLAKAPMQIVYTEKPVEELKKEDNFESNVIVDEVTGETEKLDERQCN